MLRTVTVTLITSVLSNSAKTFPAFSNNSITLVAGIEFAVVVPELQEAKQKENKITNSRISDVSLLLFTSFTPPQETHLLARLYTPEHDKHHAQLAIYRKY